MIKIKKRSKKLVILGLVILLVLAGGSIFLFNQLSKKAGQTDSSAGQQEPINFDAPTEQDAQRVDENKQRVVARQEQEQAQASQPDGSKKAVKPVVTYAGQYGGTVEVGGFVNGVFEDSATCTASFKRSGQTVTRSVQAVKNTNAMDCPVMAAPAGEFNPKGTWAVAISYSSPSASGVSDVRQVEVK